MPAHSLLFSKSTKGAARLNVPIPRTNRYRQYYMPSQHTYCGRVWNLNQDRDVQSSDQKVYISTPASPEDENFEMKIYYPAGDRAPDLLNQRQTCYHLSQRGEHIIFYGTLQFSNRKRITLFFKQKAKTNVLLSVSKVAPEDDVKNVVQKRSALPMRVWCMSAGAGSHDYTSTQDTAFPKTFTTNRLAEHFNSSTLYSSCPDKVNNFTNVTLDYITKMIVFAGTKSQTVEFYVRGKS